MARSYTLSDFQLIIGDCLEELKKLPDQHVHCCITSPPYWGLRDYGVEGQIGLEETPDEFISKMVAVFREVHRVLRNDGTIWVNMGDSYASNGGYGWQGKNGQRANRRFTAPNYHRDIPRHAAKIGLKPKDLVGIPWMLAFALRADGWYLRQDIIWSKPNPMPESVTDRCTKSHEYIFLLTKSAQYYYDAGAVAEPLAASSIARLSQSTLGQQTGSGRVPGKTNGNMKAVRKSGNKARKKGHDRGCPDNTGSNVCSSVPWEGSSRNKRSVWTVPTAGYSGAHFATFPTALIEPCVLAGAPPRGLILDPFSGTGTTGEVALINNRRYVGIELNPANEILTNKRLQGLQPRLAFS